MIFFCCFVMHFNYICKLSYWFVWNNVYNEFALASLCSTNFARQSLPRYIFSRWTRNICFVLAFVPYFVFFFLFVYTSSGFKMFLKLHISVTMNWFHHEVSTIFFFSMSSYLWRDVASAALTFFVSIWWSTKTIETVHAALLCSLLVWKTKPA